MVDAKHSSNDSFAYPMTCEYFMMDNRTGTLFYADLSSVENS